MTTHVLLTWSACSTKLTTFFWVLEAWCHCDFRNKAVASGGAREAVAHPPKKKKKLEQKFIFLKYREESLKFAEITLLVNLKLFTTDRLS